MSYNNFTARVMKALHFSRLPVEGMEPVSVLGIRVFVTVLPPRPEGYRWKRSTHRLMCVCPRCAWTGSLGRLDQHGCTHPERNCWGCGEPLARTTDKPLRRNGHYYCDWHCTYERHDDEPQDFDAQDRRAAAEERIDNQRRER